ncbi:hypothetical protein JX266_013514 [Neoarthrinium moseri]|nr:hypothetical protein JX266_013514 [Neoarthrinium moseri]
MLGSQTPLVGVEDVRETSQVEEPNQALKEGDENQLAKDDSPPEAFSRTAFTGYQDCEERRAAYRQGGFHPVYIGEIYNCRYVILRKIGYGRYSTVWLVRDLTEPKGSEHEFRALKVLSAECYNEETPIHEREILIRLRETDKSHAGYKYICHLVDDFEHKGPNGNHVCLVFELMGETLDSFRVWFAKHMLPNVLMRKFTAQLLMALDYVHDCGVIHTDIKPDNIFITYRNHSLIQSYLNDYPEPTQDRKAELYSPLKSQSLAQYYFSMGDPPVNFNLTLGDFGVSSWAEKHLTEYIQPTTLRAPEVLIGAPWDWTTDWWNLGAVILEVFRAVQMFSGKEDQNSPYKLTNHLEEIVDFFGPFPKSLLDLGDQEIVQECFNEDSTVKGSEPLGRPGLISDVYMEDLPQETRELFVDFLHVLMKIAPKIDFLRWKFWCIPGYEAKGQIRTVGIFANTIELALYRGRSFLVESH